MMSSIMVLEDDESLRETVVDLLEGQGFSALGVENAQQALKAASEYRFDIVISDIRMEGELDGLGALEVLKAGRPDLKCIVMTGFADDGSPQRALRIEVEDYLYKPFRLPELFRSVERVRGAKAESDRFQAILHDLWKTNRGDTLQELNRQRSACFSTFLVAIRSKLVNPETALVHWDQLEATEIVYYKLLRTGEIRAEWIQSGCKRYQDIQDGLKRHSEKKTQVFSGQREAEAVDRRTFRNFIERIQAGFISTEQLHMAALVRLSPSARDSNPELQRLYSRMWTTEALPEEELGQSA